MNPLDLPGPGDWQTFPIGTTSEPDDDDDESGHDDDCKACPRRNGRRSITCFRCQELT